MYGKLFTQMYDGTLATKGPWQALVTFQQLIILADKTGCVDMTAEVISRRTTIPLEIIQIGLLRLQDDDPASRSDAEDGKRIVLINPNRDWGWRVVNYDHYRKIRSEEERREYHREYARNRRASTKESTVVNTSTGGEQNQPIAVSSKQEAEVIDQEISTLRVEVNANRVDVPFRTIIGLYHEKLPTLPAFEKLTTKRKGFIRQRWLEDLTTVEAWENYFADVATSDFLMGRSRPTGDRPPFRANLEWLCNPSNFAKVLEGNYHRAI